MKPEEAVKRLAEALRSDRLVVLVGSGASSNSKDTSGREYSGLATPRQFVAAVTKRRPYIDPKWDFVRACDEISNRESRGFLEELLVNEFRRPENFHTPPAHRILAWLPFAAYVTSNYDQFLERELERVRRRPSVVITNEDLARVRRNSVPVIKYHGCVSRPETMVATSTDHERLYKSHELVRQLITINLAKSNLLVIGHGLADTDLRQLLNDLLKDLGNYVPTIYIVREPSTAEDGFTIPVKHELIYEDLTQFLNRLVHQYRTFSYNIKAGAPVFDEAWLNSAFFAELRQASVLPSETQVLDAFLDHLVDELAARNEVQSVRSDAAIAVQLALKERPNYKALTKLWDEIDSRLLSASDDVAAAEEMVRSIIEEREQKKTSFRLLGKRVIARGERILVFSQSQRVLQTLLGVTTTIQKTCQLFIAECRPKSPYPYEDAAAICRGLSQTDFSISVCPDVVAINLIATRQIDKILMGTHAIYVDEAGEQYAFVNTCGSLALVLAAEKFGIPVVVVGEVLKLDTVPRDEAEDHLFKHDEHDLQAAASSLVELSTRRGSIHHTNIGYDLIHLSPIIHIEVPDAMAGS
jgi:translation initiation factor 2B subunit (eIF-2B alpha/beta/delta family)